MIEADGLTKRYGGVAAIQEVTFRVPRGKVAAFLGPNGAGKSTTMRIVTGFIPASSGEVLVDGLDVTRYPMEVRRRIGYLPEHTPLYTDMRVDESVTASFRSDDLDLGRVNDVLQRLQARAVGAVDDLETLRLDVVADLVGLGEVSVPARGLAPFEEVLEVLGDLGCRRGRRIAA